MGSKSNPQASEAKGSRPEGFLCFPVWLLVWIVSVTGVTGLPAAIDAGENVAVAPGGRPLMLKVILPVKVVAPSGVKVSGKVAAAPAATVASDVEPELGAIPTVVATIKLAVSDPAEKFTLADSEALNTTVPALVMVTVDPEMVAGPETTE